MPSPVGHALGGIAAGWLLQGPAGRGACLVDSRQAAVTFALLAMAPDLDLFLEVHRGPTHSLGAALAIGGLTWLLVRTRRADPARFAAACAAAYASHIL